MEKNATIETGTTTDDRLKGLYAITSTNTTDTDILLRQVEQALAGGARLIQYRNKNLQDPAREQQARVLLDVCHQFSAPLIINDDVELAFAVSADGVHLGGDDMAYEQARARLGRGAIIGISCYNQLERGLMAQALGADYVAFGRFFPSRTKPQAVQADVALLQQARRLLRVPIAAIGGITPDNGAELIEAGADMLAVIDAVFGAEDITAAAQRFAQCFK